jgi:hypothetical protein
MCRVDGAANLCQLHSLAFNQLSLEDGIDGMAVFAVLADNPNEKLGAKIVELYPTDHYKLTDSQWLVAADTIPQNLAEQLGVRTGTFGKVIVIRATASASGWHNQTVWEWLRQKSASG